MENRRRLLLGILIVLIGLYVILPIPNFGIGSFVLLFGGLALILVYVMKRRTGPLILGGYMTYLGVVQLTGRFLPEGTASGLFISMFFIVPGVIFIVLYIDKNKYRLLLPGLILLSFGTFLFVRGMPVIRLIGAAPLLMLFMGIAFIAAHVIGRGYVGKWAMKIGRLFIVAFCLLLLLSFVSGVIQTLGVILIVVGGYIFIAAMIKWKK